MNHWPILVGLAGAGVFARMTNRWFGWVAWLMAGLAAWGFFFWKLNWEFPKELFAVVGVTSVVGLTLIDLGHGLGVTLRHPRTIATIVGSVALAGAVLFVPKEAIEKTFLIIATIAIAIVMVRNGFSFKKGGKK